MALPKPAPRQPSDGERNDEGAHRRFVRKESAQRIMHPIESKSEMIELHSEMRHLMFPSIPPDLRRLLASVAVTPVLGIVIPH
jgi:hypothetical protein